MYSRLEAGAAFLLVAALVLIGCGQQRSTRATVLVANRPSLPGRYPSAADYNTLRSARGQVHRALSERDWRRQQYAAYLGIAVLMTVHPLESGRCREFIAHTYDELLSLHDNYRGENWAPLVAVVRHDPPVTVCRAPPRPKVSLTA